MEAIREFFAINRPVVLFVYGLTFFVIGLAIFLHTRRHSRLRLARDLYWLAAFGLLHGMHEWGILFIPLQAEYLPAILIELLATAQVLLLALSFLCLLMFGAVTLQPRWPQLRVAVLGIGFVWSAGFWSAAHLSETTAEWHRLSDIWARYLIAFPGGLLAAYGLRFQASTAFTQFSSPRILQALRYAGLALIAYAFFGGLVVRYADFFPANTLNVQVIEGATGIPIEVLRSLTGLVLVFAIIRALEIFELEIDKLLEDMEITRIQAAERERIGQEIHDGAIQGVYSASLILESMEPLVAEEAEVAKRLHQAKSVLSAVNMDLRSYMISLRTESPSEALVPSIRKLIADPRFQGLLTIDLVCAFEPNLKPLQVHQVIAIIQESLSNILRHARARQVTITIRGSEELTCVCIRDDGRGFTPKSDSMGYGIRSMRDRARLLGGQLEIASDPGQGTTITLRFQEENLR